MHNPKLWWLAPLPNGTFQYMLETYEDIMEIVNLPAIPVIVHPDNPIYPKEYRAYNRRHIKFINALKIGRINRMLELGVPRAVVAHEADFGMFAYHCHVLAQPVE